jgi:hypothetical protein
MRWTPSQVDRLIVLYAAGYTYPHIAERFGRTSGQVSCKLYEMRKKKLIPKRKRKKPIRIKPIWHEPPLPVPIPAELPTYVDENGRTVKRCPTRWADGYDPQNAVRPSRKRRK